MQCICNLVICFVLLFLSLGFYQANISIFIILLLGIAWIRRNETRTIIKGIVIGGLASFINILILRLFVQTGLSSGTERHAELNVVFNNIKILLFDRYSGQRGVLLNSLNLLPRGLFAIFVVFLLGCLVWLGIYKKNKARDFLWLSPRTLTALFFFLGILVCMVLKSFYDHRNTAKGIIAILFLFFSINYWSVQGIIVNHFATTKIDQNYARDIYCEIQKYEKATGTEIVSIAPVNDISPLWYNPYVEYTSFDVNKRIVPQEWCDVNLINFVSGRSFYRLEMPDDIYLNYFEGKDWDYYCPEEQLYFKENTLYWCIY